MSTRKSSKTRSKQKKFLLRFRSQPLYDAALHHPSYRNENPAPKVALQDFDRLEFFGDAILNFVICKKIFPLFPKADEGMLSRLRSILVSRKILFRIAKQIGLLKQVKLAKGLLGQEEFLKIKLAADALEALIGALYLDQGLPKTEKFILKHYRTYFDAKKLFRLDPNPKSTLQELVQKRWQKLPVYSSGITDKGIKTTVFIHRGRQANALGRTRKESEEKAARLLIRKIRQEALGRPKNKSSVGKL